uniref:Uncharacterized protein n=1 Tax=Anguilla anguilla TaxID=7936 RepID=A0A0E9WWQ2_ANGAN
MGRTTVPSGAFRFKPRVLNCCTLLPPTSTQCSPPLGLPRALLLGLHGKQQPGGVFGVALTIDQHQGLPLIVLDHTGDTAEMLLSCLLAP